MKPKHHRPPARRRKRESCWSLATRRARHARERSRRRKRKGILMGLLSSPEGVFLIAFAAALTGGVLATSRSARVQPVAAAPMRRPARPRKPEASTRPGSLEDTLPRARDYLPPVPPAARKLARDLALLKRRAGKGGPHSVRAWERLREFGEDVEVYVRWVEENRGWNQVRRDVRTATARLPVLHAPAPSDRRLYDEEALACWACIPLWAERGQAILNPPPPPPAPEGDDLEDDGPEPPEDMQP